MKINQGGFYRLNGVRSAAVNGEAGSGSGGATAAAGDGAGRYCERRGGAGGAERRAAGAAMATRQRGVRRLRRR